MPLEVRLLKNRDNGLAFIKERIKRRLNRILLVLELIRVIEYGCLKKRHWRQLIGVARDDHRPRPEDRRDCFGCWKLRSLVKYDQIKFAASRLQESRDGDWTHEHARLQRLQNVGDVGEEPPEGPYSFLLLKLSLKNPDLTDFS